MSYFHFINRSYNKLHESYEERKKERNRLTKKWMTWCNSPPFPGSSLSFAIKLTIDIRYLPATKKDGVSNEKGREKGKLPFCVCIPTSLHVCSNENMNVFTNDLFWVSNCLSNNIYMHSEREMHGAMIKINGTGGEKICI